MATVLPGGRCDPTEVVEPGEGHCDGGKGEVGGGVLVQRVVVWLLGQAPHLFLHLQKTNENFSSQIQVNYGWNYFALIRTNNKLYFGAQAQNCPGTENLNRNKYSISLSIPSAKSRPKSLGIKRWKIKRVVGQAPPGKDHPHPPPPLPRPEGWSPFSLSFPDHPSSSSPLL